MIPHLATLRTLAATAPGAQQRADPRDETSPLLSAAQRDIVSRLATAALELFEARGFEATTIDEIARGAGLNRRTFFRYFPAKEDVLFAHHVDRLHVLDRRLELAGRDRLETARHAIEALIDGEIREPALSLRRHRVVDSTLPLRDRETLWLSEYQRRVGEYLADAVPGGDRLRADMAASALVAAVRGVLAEWAASPVPREAGPVGLRRRFADLTEPIAPLLAGASGQAPAGRPATTLVALFESTLPAADLRDVIGRSGIAGTP